MSAVYEERFWRNVEKTDGCWLWQSALNAGGYGVIYLDGRSWTAHRYSWTFANGPIPAGQYICHTCDVRACVNPSHLFLGSAKDNTHDMIRKGRHAYGAITQVLSDADVVRIKTLYAEGYCQKEIARNLGFTRGNVRDIIQGRSRRHIQPEPVEDTTERRFWAQVNKDAANGCWVWAGEIREGYGHFVARTPHGQVIRASRYSWYMHKGPVEKGKFVGHSCFNPACVNPDHLQIVGRHDHAQGKPLTPEKVVMIRQLHDQGVPGQVIGRRFGIHSTTAAQIVKREIWRHVL